VPIAVAAQSKAWICGLSIAGNEGSNPEGDMDVSCGCCLLSGKGLCEGPFLRPEQSYPMCLYMCVCVCVIEGNQVKQ